jgi:hypothetical protein
MTFSANESISDPTVIFANTPLYYQNTPPAVAVQPAGYATVSAAANNRIELMFSPAVVTGQVFTVTVTAA